MNRPGRWMKLRKPGTKPTRPSRAARGMLRALPFAAGRARSPLRAALGLAVPQKSAPAASHGWAVTYTVTPPCITGMK